MHEELCILNFFQSYGNKCDHFGAPSIFSLQREIHAETSRHSLVNFLHYRRETDKTDIDTTIIIYERRNDFIHVLFCCFYIFFKIVINFYILNNFLHFDNVEDIQRCRV